jgi:hypothetical protein
MTKGTFTTAVLSLGAVFALTIPARAGAIISMVGSYDSPNGYDYVTTLPPTSFQLIGTFTFALPPGQTAAAITISGSFGSLDVPNTELSDYYLGFSGNEEAVEVASCDSISANCYSGLQGPYAWSTTLTQTQIAALAPAIAAGSIDFTYTWDSSPPVQPVMDALSPTLYDPQYVYAGAATLAITATPEPATVLFCFGGLAGLAAFRRFRKN